MNNNFIKTARGQTKNALQSKTNHITFLVFGIFSIVMFFTIASTSSSFADSQTTSQLTEEFSLEKTVVVMSVPDDNVLPWGTVKGTVDNHASGYPVIIQFFNEENGEDPIHIAQVDVNADDTYEYKFRVRDVNLETGEATNIFEGDYTVKIFKVVNSPQTELDTI